MTFQKVSFKNHEDQLLSGKLELPPDRRPHNFAILAHCFTCTKNITATVNIGRALTLAGFGVLRFDFTGLGESEGDFEDSNFSGNIQDLIAAAGYLKENFLPPTLIVGHSLGGIASIYAAEKIDSIRAVAVINSPSSPEHVMHLIKDEEEKIKEKGKALVNIGGRDFYIKKQFIDDIYTHSPSEVVSNLQKALLILHTPQDAIVDIKNAERLYIAARHPKSFISLDGADHLLSNREDSRYAGEMIANWTVRYVDIESAAPIRTQHQVAASLDAEDLFTTQLRMGKHSFLADEPVRFGGNNFGPTPYDLLSAGLAACTAMTVQMYARRKEWNVENITVHINHSREHAIDCEKCEESNAKIDTFKKSIELKGNLSDDQKRRLMQIADRCPVHKTLSQKIQIISSLSTDG